MAFLDSLREIELRTRLVHASDSHDEIIESLNRVIGLDDKQWLAALNHIAGPYEQLCHASRPRREDRRRAIFVDCDLALGQMLRAKQPLFDWLNLHRRPLRRSWVKNSRFACCRRRTLRLGPRVRSRPMQKREQERADGNDDQSA